MRNNFNFKPDPLLDGRLQTYKRILQNKEVIIVRNKYTIKDYIGIFMLRIKEMFL